MKKICLFTVAAAVIVMLSSCKDKSAEPTADQTLPPAVTEAPPSATEVSPSPAEPSVNPSIEPGNVEKTYNGAKFEISEGYVESVGTNGDIVFAENEDRSISFYQESTNGNVADIELLRSIMRRLVDEMAIEPVENYPGLATEFKQDGFDAIRCEYTQEKGTKIYKCVSYAIAHGGIVTRISGFVKGGDVAAVEALLQPVLDSLVLANWPV